MKEIIEAIQFYAEKSNYHCDHLSLKGDGISNIANDEGALARAALPLLAALDDPLPSPGGKSFVLSWEGKALGKNRKLIRAKKRSFPCKEYYEFIDNICEEFKIQGKVLNGELRVTMKFVCHARADHHNFIEPILDAMQKSGCIKNDRDVSELILPRPERHGNKENDKIIIKVEELGL